jgi:PAS domain S-box-containing protein
MLEMQQLVLHFNGMAQALSKSHGEMESLVQSRTSELAEANQKLQTEILKRREFEKELQNYALQLAGTADDLRQKEKEQAVLLANIPDLVIFRDAEGRYCYVNPAFERVAGIKLESVIGRTCDVLFDAAGARFSRMYDLQSRESRKTVVAELQLAAKGNGEARDYLTTRSPLFDEAGEFQGTIAVFHDITVRKRDEAALAHVMAELQSLKVALDQHAIVSIADVSGNITYANAKFNEVSQYGQEELLGHNHRLLNSGLHPKEFWIEMWVTISQGKVWHDVIRNRKKDGSFYWVDSTIVPFLDANCVPYQYVSIRTDITQMKLAEESLQGLNLRLKMLNASSDALIHVGEENALLQEICDIVVEIGGYPMAWVGLAEDDAEKTVRSVASAGFGKEYVDLVNVTWGEGHMSGEGPVGTAIRSAVPCVIADVNADPAFSPWRELAKERGYRSVAALPLEVEGQIVGALAVYASEPDAFGQEELGALAELVADMGFGIKSLRVQSEKNRLLEALRHSHERWNQIFELSPDPTSLRRLSDGIYLEVNDAFCRAFGYQSEAVIGHDAVELGIWVDREEYQAMARGIAEHGQVNGQEVRLRSGTGEIRWATLSATALDYAGERCILAVSHDITERKRSALVLSQAKDAAEQASRAKSEFLARMSHELRTPLNAILGFAQLLEHDPKVPLEAGQRDSVQHIIKGGWYLLQLINDVLDLSRIEAGRMTINTEPVEVGRLLRDCLKLVAPAAAEKRGIVMHNQVPELQQLWVKADPVRLKQIVLNLLSNAVKYNRQSGSVTLGIQQTENDFLRISVTDQGPGISAQQQTQLFASFSRLDADKKGIDGTGIGLSIAKNMVELMGGRIGLESEVGSGSTFWIELPQASGPTDGEMGGKVQPDDFIPRKNDAAPCVLYIDGMLPNQELMRMLLGQHRPDIRLILAATGEAGLEAARMEIPSMILVDFGLSDMEGLDLLNALRYDPDTSAIPVFALCSNIYPEKLEQAKQVGLAGHFTKPVDIRQLLSTLAEVVPK